MKQCPDPLLYVRGKNKWLLRPKQCWKCKTLFTPAVTSQGLCPNCLPIKQKRSVLNELSEPETVGDIKNKLLSAKYRLWYHTKKRPHPSQAMAVKKEIEYLNRKLSTLTEGESNCKPQ